MTEVVGVSGVNEHHWRTGAVMGSTSFVLLIYLYINQWAIINGSRYLTQGCLMWEEALRNGAE